MALMIKKSKKAIINIRAKIDATRRNFHGHISLYAMKRSGLPQMMTLCP